MEDLESSKTDLERTKEVQSQRAEVAKGPAEPGWWDSLTSRMWARIKGERLDKGDDKKVFSEFEVGKAYTGEPMVCTTIICGNAAIDQAFKFDKNGQLNGIVVNKRWLGEWEEEVDPTEGPMGVSPELRKTFQALGGDITDLQLPRFEHKF